VTAYPFPAEGLRVDELLVREFATTDVPTLAPALLDPDVGGEAGLPRLSEAELTAWIAGAAPGLRASGFLLPLTIAGPDGPLGGAMLTRHDPARGQVEVGYWLLRSSWGRGVATRVVRALAEQAFSTGLARVVATIRPENTASIAVVERIGFQREGLLRSALPYRDGRADAFLYALLPAV
jgi:RimJ/RimL family protein N-acetyltransferase